MAVITLTSDFGTHDAYVGIMKGVILGIAPDARLVDLTHEIPPQDIDEAAYVLEGAVPYFPAGTVHLAVVDPGVGSARRPLLVTTERAAFVGPDNGLFSFALSQPDAQAWALDRPEYWLPRPSRTFHGRDVFAPVAAHLAAGTPAERLGTRIADPIVRSRPAPAHVGNGEIVGHVLHVDRFGNILTDVPGDWLAGSSWTCEIAGTSVRGLSQAYAEAEPGELLLLIDSTGMAEVAVREGSAAERLHVQRGATARFRTG